MVKSKSVAQHSVAALASGGAFARVIQSFRERPQQLRMAELVATAITNCENLLVEAGTGIGKTYAYLVPAILSGKKVVISTGTRNLQDQLFYKDLSQVLKILNKHVDVALLKGRANYLCRERLDRAFEQPDLFDGQNSGVFAGLRKWTWQTADGDIAGYGGLPEKDHLWRTVTSTTESCLRKQCQRYDDCFVAGARKRALDADLVVVNHHLLLADMELKEEGFGSILPTADTIIVDEAHQIAKIADNFFGTLLSANLVRQLVADVQALAEQPESPVFDQLETRCKALLSTVNEMGKALAKHPKSIAWNKLQHDRNFVEAAEKLCDRLAVLLEVLEPAKEHSENFDNVFRRGADFYSQMEGLDEARDDQVAWVRHENGKGFKIHLSPLSLAPVLRTYRAQYQANWIYTSATLTVDGDFGFFASSLGIDDCASEQLDSPFDYRQQAALYLPSNLPLPESRAYTKQLVNVAVELVEMSGGGVFFLFTSHRALKEAAKLLESMKNYVVLVQGQASKRQLIERFCAEPKPILLGTSSFWEGVDVSGPKLRCVIIDRLPFAAPGDPLMQGRRKQAEKNSRNFFLEYSLPQAVIDLRQGVGRLIRSETDRGVIMIGDQRLVTHSYGKCFLSSLPLAMMERFRELPKLKKYLQ